MRSKRFTDAQVEKLKIMYGSLTYYKGEYLVSCGNTKRLVCNNGMLSEEIHSLKSVYKDLAIVDKGNILSMKTGRVLDLYGDWYANADVNIVAAIGDYYIIEYTDFNANVSAMGVTKSIIPGIKFSRVGIISASNLKIINKEINNMNQFLARVECTDKTIKAIVYTPLGGLGTIEVKYNGIDKIEHNDSGADEVERIEDIVNIAFLSKLNINTGHMQMFSTCEKELKMLLINKIDLRSNHSLAFTMALCAIMYIKKKLYDTDYSMELRDNYTNAVYDIVEQILENGLVEYYRKKLTQYKNSKYTKEIIKAIINKTGDKEIKIEGVAAGLNIIRSLTRLLREDEDYTIWRQNKYTCSIINKFRSSFKRDLDRIRNERSSKLSYNFYAGIYDELFCVHTVCNNDELYNSGVHIAKLVVKEYIMNGEIRNSKYFGIIYNIEIDDDKLNSIRSYIDKIINNIGSVTIYERSSTETDYVDTKAFNIWRGGRIIKESELHII